MSDVFITKDECIAELKTDLRKAFIKIGGLEVKLETYKNQNHCYLALLGLRNRIELLEKFLYPSELISVNNRMLKWKLLLEVQREHPVVKQLRDRITKRLSIDQFVTQLSSLYASFSESMVHKLNGKIYTAEEMQEMLEENKDNLNEFQMIIIEVLFQKLDITAADEEIVDGSFKFIRIKKIPSDREMETKIKTYFRGRKSIVAITKQKDGVYVVEFENINEAISAFLNHESAIDNHLLHLSISNNTHNEIKDDDI